MLGAEFQQYNDVTTLLHHLHSFSKYIFHYLIRKNIYHRWLDSERRTELNTHRIIKLASHHNYWVSEKTRKGQSSKLSVVIKWVTSTGLCVLTEQEQLSINVKLCCAGGAHDSADNYSVNGIVVDRETEVGNSSSTFCLIKGFTSVRRFKILCFVWILTFMWCDDNLEKYYNRTANPNLEKNAYVGWIINRDTIFLTLNKTACTWRACTSYV